MMKLIFTFLGVIALHSVAKASMDPVYILKADMICTNGKTISGYFSDYEFQDRAMTACDGDTKNLSSAIPFQMDATSTPIVPKLLFETIENQKVVNYFIYICGENITVMLINYNPAISLQQLETWAKTLFQPVTGCSVDRFNVLFAQKVVAISTVAE